jgi:hypothetical protein
MTGTRRTPEASTADGLDALGAALEACHIVVRTEHAGGAFDAVVDVLVDDRPLTLAVEVKAYGTGAVARQVMSGRPGVGAGVIPVLVAERITTEARELLTEAGWSWLDRRGRLHLHGPAVRVDADVPALRASEPATSGPAVKGRSGLTIAYWLLAHPGRSLSPTGDAAELRLAPSTISTVTRRLAEAGLLDDDRRALVPELFWELAAVWRADRASLATPPDPARHRNPDPAALIWRRAGSVAAAAWGAPMVTSEGGPIELYVPGPVDVSIARRRYGAAEAGAGAAVLTIAPATPVVAGVDSGHPVPVVDGWPVAPKLAVALDLAQDKARGREILADWADPDGVWR